MISRHDKIIIEQLEELGGHAHLEHLRGRGMQPVDVEATLQRLKSHGTVDRDNTGEWYLAATKPAAPAAAIPHEVRKPMTKETPTEGAGRRCSICKKTKPPAEMRSNGYCKTCGQKYDRDRKKTAAGVTEYVGKRGKKKANGAGVPMTVTSGEPMVINLFSIRIFDHGGEIHDITINSTAARQLLAELRECIE